MICPNCCAPKTQILDGNLTHLRLEEPPGSGQMAYRRRRYCGKCHTRFSTLETFEVLRPGPHTHTDDGDGFERWLTPGLPYDTNLRELRRAYEAGLSRDEALARARVQRVTV